MYYIWAIKGSLLWLIWLINIHVWKDKLLQHGETRKISLKNKNWLTKHDILKNLHARLFHSILHSNHDGQQHQKRIINLFIPYTPRLLKPYEQEGTCRNWIHGSLITFPSIELSTCESVWPHHWVMELWTSQFNLRTPLTGSLRRTGSNEWFIH